MYFLSSVWISAFQNLSELSDLPKLSAASLLVGMDSGAESPVGFGLVSPFADQASGVGSEMQQLAFPQQKAAANVGAQGLKPPVVPTAFSGYNKQQPKTAT